MFQLHAPFLQWYIPRHKAHLVVASFNTKMSQFTWCTCKCNLVYTHEALPSLNRFSRTLNSITWRSIYGIFTNNGQKCGKVGIGLTYTFLRQVRRSLHRLLDALAKLRKATIIFVMSVRQSVRTEQLGCQWTDVREIWFDYFSKICREISSIFKSDKKTNIHLWSHLAQFFVQWEMSDIKVVEKIKTHILCSITFFSRKSGRFWDNVEKYCIARQAGDVNTIRPMCIACRVPLATKTHSEYVANTYCFSTATIVPRTHLNVT